MFDLPFNGPVHEIDYPELSRVEKLSFYAGFR